MNLQQVQEVQQVLRFPSVHHLPEKRSNLLGISIRKTWIFNNQYGGFSFDICHYLHVLEDSTFMYDTHRSSRQSSLSWESSQSWGSIFARASRWSWVSFGAFLS